MYENGKRVNGYHRKRIHKQESKNKFAKTWWYGNSAGDWNQMVIDYLRDPEYRSLDYWKTFYLSGCRKVAKTSTSRRLRNIFKSYVAREDYDNIPVLNNADYRKYFDYDWTIW